MYDETGISFIYGGEEVNQRALTESSGSICSTIAYRMLTTTNDPQDQQTARATLEGNTLFHLAQECSEEEFEFWLGRFDDEPLKKLLLVKTVGGSALHYANTKTLPLLLHHAQRLGVLKDLLRIRAKSGNKHAIEDSLMLSQDYERSQLLTRSLVWTQTHLE